jgi:hypothetical protein
MRRLRIGKPLTAFPTVTVKHLVSTSTGQAALGPAA